MNLLFSFGICVTTFISSSIISTSNQEREMHKLEEIKLEIENEKKLAESKIEELKRDFEKRRHLILDELNEKRIKFLEPYLEDVVINRTYIKKSEIAKIPEKLYEKTRNDALGDYIKKTAPLWKDYFITKKMIELERDCIITSLYTKMTTNYATIYELPDE
ncbi:uncharacterized protein VNE69_09145 [Vairimorpha necatrix]|uniref:Uncharacterized protein n=1 Tax=Vairimorpha necatrix TaxID=6039 RepID=A0AAX4JFF8_9MICR